MQKKVVLTTSYRSGVLREKTFAAGGGLEKSYFYHWKITPLYEPTSFDKKQVFLFL